MFALRLTSALITTLPPHRPGMWFLCNSRNSPAKTKRLDSTLSGAWYGQTQPAPRVIYILNCIHAFVALEGTLYHTLSHAFVSIAVIWACTRSFLSLSRVKIENMKRIRNLCIYNFHQEPNAHMNCRCRSHFWLYRGLRCPTRPWSTLLLTPRSWAGCELGLSSFHAHSICKKM